MTVNVAVAEGVQPPLGSQDERILHRGPMRRWLISPEIGALIGAVVVWLFLWGNGETFGTAGTTLNWLDVAAPYGIMATAVALLMIGGEFDLSSGVITGGTAMMIGLMSRYFAGGMHIGWAILACFAAAGAVGWFNGYMVNKTGLPSFIITLASFFVMRGLMLVLSKRLADKVYVDQIKDQKGAPLFSQWIAHEWRLTTFTGRDVVYVVLAIAGSSLFAIGLLDQSFVRRSSTAAKALGAFLVGLVVAISGFVFLLKTDGVANNTIGALITSFGVVVAIVALALARWESRNASAATTNAANSNTEVVEPLPRSVQVRTYLGILGVALACLIPIPFSRNERRPVLSWISSGVRPIIVGLAALLGMALALRTLAGRDRNSRPKGIALLKPLLFALYSALVLTTLVVSALQLSTIQAFRAVGMMILGSGGIGLLLTARSIAGKNGNRKAQLLTGAIAAGSLVLIGLVSRLDSSAARFRTVLPAALSICATLLLANSLLEYVMKKRSYGDPVADRFAKRLQLIGALMVVVGGAIRLLFTNFTAAQAKKLADANEPVPQNVLRETVLWWLLVAAIGSYVLLKTKWGNWIFAVGGNKEAARAIGVPADRVKISLFVAVSICGAISGTLIALRYGTVQADQGTGNEFEYIIAAVVGGCLMTGGYGSVIGASLGAAILAMSSTGFQTVQGWNGDGRYAFLGGVLLVAVLFNTYTRKKALESR
jgi:ribose/xylose/arabinose/galactoside ABC-type transport system permease subunit